MPTSTFFNLPDAKRQRLTEAAWLEFSAYPYLEVSINRIIQTAGISRGSFYQYFSGKQELFSYLLQTALQTGRQMFQAQLTAHHNDLFAALLGMYDILLWRKNHQQHTPESDRFRRLVQLNIDLDHSLFAELLDYEAMTADAMALLADSGYPMEHPQQCAAVLHMLMNVGLCALNNSVRCPEREPIHRRLLEDQLAIIQKGIRK